MCVRLRGPHGRHYKWETRNSERDKPRECDSQTLIVAALRPFGFHPPPSQSGLVGRCGSASNVSNVMVCKDASNFHQKSNSQRVMGTSTHELESHAPTYGQAISHIKSLGGKAF